MESMLRWLGFVLFLGLVIAGGSYVAAGQTTPPVLSIDQPTGPIGQAGTLQVSLYDQVYRWRTPLGSLLPAKVDAKTGEEFPGNYSFNPYTGEKLSARWEAMWGDFIAGFRLRAT